MVFEVDQALVGLNRCAIGDKIVIVAGSPPGSPGKTNALRVHRIGDAIALPYPLTGSGPARGRDPPVAGSPAGDRTPTQTMP